MPAPPVVVAEGLLGVVMQPDCWPPVMKLQRWWGWTPDLQMLLLGAVREGACEVKYDCLLAMHACMRRIPCMCVSVPRPRGYAVPSWEEEQAHSSRLSRAVGHAGTRHGDERLRCRCRPAGVQRPGQRMSCLAAGTPLLSHQLLAEPFSKGCSSGMQASAAP